jgi:NADPH:quinone reductase-like Zn-dependent oxidoreductase
MKAFRIHRYGGPDVAKLEDVLAPTVHDKDVLIDVRAASLNPIDFKLRDGKVKFVAKPPMPITLGCDVAGTVAAVGPGVTRWKPGDAVFARLEKGRMGGLAEQVAADESVIAAKPAKLSFEEAASIPLAGLTALQALREKADVKPGQRVLVHAGAGGVGSLAIQIARRLGAHVLATGSTKNLELIRSLGAHEAVDYTTGAVDELRDLDVVFDTLGGDSEIRSLQQVKRGGVVVGVSGLPDGEFARTSMPGFIRPVIWLITGRRRRAAKKAGTAFRYLFMRPDGAQLAELASWVEDGTLRPLLHKTFPLAQVREAFAELETGRARGKVVVSVTSATSS